MIRDEKGRLVRDEAVWTMLDEAMAAMPRQVRSLRQQPLDMRTPLVIRYPSGSTATNWGEIVAAEAVGDAKPIAWWGERVVGIETERTVWLGTREGMNLHAISSRMEAHRATEPCNPFPAELPDRYEAHRPYAEALGYAARKAGVTRPVVLLQNGRLPMNLEVLPRQHPNGTLMVVVINHDPTEATYDVHLQPGLAPTGAMAWEMLTETDLSRSVESPFPLAVPAWGVRVLLVGRPADLEPMQTAQMALNRKDLSVPPYFLERPALNEGEWGTPIPPIEP